MRVQLEGKHARGEEYHLRIFSARLEPCDRGARVVLLHQDSSRCNRLPDVTLRMIGDVHQQAGHRRGQFVSCPRSRLCSRTPGRTLALGPARGQCRIEFGEKRISPSPWIQFRFQSGQLVVRQVSPLGVGQQPVEASCDVAQMKCHRRQSGRTRIDLFIVQASAPALQVFFCQLQRVHDCPLHRGNFLQRAPQPGLGGFRSRHSHLPRRVNLTLCVRSITKQTVPGKLWWCRHPALQC